MARDRKKGRQRQRQRSRAQRQSPAPVPGQDETVPPVPDQDEIVHSTHEDEPDAAPDPLADSSGEVEIAEAAERAMETLDGPHTPLEEDEYPHPDETDGADALEGERHPGAASGGQLPREGNRFANFLRACVAELQRVQWPNRRQVGQATTVVLGFVVVAGGYLGLLDAVFSRVMNAIL